MVAEITHLLELFARLAGTGSGASNFTWPHRRSDPTYVLFVFLAFWTVVGAAAVSTLLWGLVGKERVTLAYGVLMVERRIPFWVRRCVYDAAEADPLRASGLPFVSNVLGGFALPMPFVDGFRHGTIQFDYGKVRWGFGLELDPVEAQDLVAELETYRTR